MISRRTVALFLVTVLLGCSSGSHILEADQATLPDVRFTFDSHGQLPDMALDGAQGDSTDLWFFDADLGISEVGPQCLPGEGCFLDPCQENGQCQSGWCVEHLGEGVCTIACSDECPAGWSCQQVAGTAPDLVFVCVSNFANLCRPCASGNDCQSVGGAEDVCVAYGEEGSFCGGGCQEPTDCPLGFSCLEASTVDGISTLQCVADTGSCPCTDKAVALSLFTPCQVANQWGSCLGKRVCTAAGLTNCDASIPGPESCNGLDDNCDGNVDEPALVEGKFVELCDDSNSCTMDACTGAAGCTHVALSEGECVDNNPCTVGDHCLAGECVGQPLVCDDENPCTDDSCDGLGGCQASPNTEPCDDADPCTVNDTCSQGTCGGYAVACDCQADADCQALEDGDLCNGTLICDQSKLPYQCVVDPDTIVTCAPPPEGPDAICLASACNSLTGLCSLVPDHGDLACEDGDACTVGDSCQEGICTPGVPINCNDGNPCTDESCDAALGCNYTNNQAPCSDGNVCTLGDVCQMGLCQSGSQNLVCNDDNPCTDDSCNPQFGCQHANNLLPCDDGNPCTSGEACANGWCIGGESTVCDDGNPCTTDSCDANGGCVYKLNKLPCDDANLCTQGDHCHLGECIGAIALVCDDNNLCTDDACIPDTGCQYTPNQAPCSDGNACTTLDQCSNGWCTATGTLSCNDNNPCTDDACDANLGCQYVSNDQDCDDGDACTLGDLCAGGQCLPGPNSPDCNDDNLCTTDACDPATGCTHTALSPCCGNGAVEAGEGCDDGNLVDGDGCSSLCQLDTGCVILGADVRTLEQGPEKWQLGYCQTLCEDSQTTIPAGWHIATKAEVGFLTKHVKFGSCAAYGICGAYWYGGDSLSANCDSLKYNCTTGGCWAYTTHCYTQVMLIRDGKDGTCLQ
jgi:cysteine-rich repeat protein